MEYLFGNYFLEKSHFSYMEIMFSELISQQFLAGV